MAHAVEASSIASEFALPGEPSYWVGYCLLVQAEVQRALGRKEPARQLAAQSQVQLVPTVGAEHPSTQKAARLASG